MVSATIRIFHSQRTSMAYLHASQPKCGIVAHTSMFALHVRTTARRSSICRCAVWLSRAGLHLRSGRKTIGLGRLRRLKTAEITFVIDNVATERTYRRVGFRFAAEVRDDAFAACDGAISIFNLAVKL